MKSLNIDAILPWEVGIVIVIIGIILVYVGNRQGKKKQIDFDNLPFIKPTSKIVFGVFCIIFGSVQLLPILK